MALLGVRAAAAPVIRMLCHTWSARSQAGQSQQHYFQVCSLKGLVINSSSSSVLISFKNNCISATMLLRELSAHRILDT